MFSSFFKMLYYLFIVISILICFISIFFIPYIENDEILKGLDGKEIIISEYGFAWPIPGYSTITSPFGRRVSPTAGASNFHKGIDIGAPEGTVLIAAVDGTITYTDFLGGGGYTITLSSDNLKITYCHVSPNFLVEIGQEVLRGQIIGQVGPKYVYGVQKNTYHDENGNPTNGATTGCHLHFGIRENNTYVNPLNYYWLCLPFYWKKW